MNIVLNTKTGQVYVGGIKPKNRVFKDEKGYYLIEGYGKFMGKKYPMKKHFTPSENEVLDAYMQDKYAKGGGVFDENRQMVLNNNKQIRHHTEELPRAVKGNKHIPAWVVSKVGRSASDLSDVTHFLEGEAGTKYGRGGTTVEKEHEIETDIEDEDIIVVEFIYTVSKENDGIGSYEFHGSRGYDSGTDYIVVEDIEWDKSSHTDRENEVIQKYLDKNFSSLAEDMSESLDPQDFGKGGTTKSWNYEIGGL